MSTQINPLLFAGPLLLGSIGLFTASVVVRPSEDISSPAIVTPKDRLPNGFVALDAKAGASERQIINSALIVELASTWDPTIPVKKQTKKNAKWTYVVMSTGAIFKVDEPLDKFLGRVRNQQQ
tara:strand:+ start:252 stop:620 length:369 start_codon:yes stop_codon:yes gene_type:complete